MSKIRKFFSKQWGDIKENAKWDFIKWGGLCVIAFLTSIIRFIQNAPLWQVIVALILTCVCVFFLISMIQSLVQKPHSIDIKNEVNAIKIDSIVCEKIIGYKIGCRVKILNESPTVPAKNLKVELVKIDPIPKWKEAPTENLPITFPMRLRAKENDGDIINPKDSSLFEVFMVTRGGFDIQFEFVTDAMWKAFEYSYFQENPISEYHLTIAVSADFCPRIEQSFKITILENMENRIIFSRLA